MPKYLIRMTLYFSKGHGRQPCSSADQEEIRLQDCLRIN